MRDHIKQQVLNYSTMTDLAYHVRLLQFIIDDPTACADREPSMAELRVLN